MFIAILWRMLEPFLFAIGLRIEKNILDLALHYVQQAAERTDMTSQQKKEWVAYQIEHEDWSTGNKPADYVLNLAVEFAVAHLKGHGPQQPATTPAS